MKPLRPHIEALEAGAVDRKEVRRMTDAELDAEIVRLTRRCTEQPDDNVRTDGLESKQ